MTSAIARILGGLPLVVLHGLGAIGGWVVYVVSSRYRRNLRANLAQAGFTAPSIRRAAIAAAGRQALEILAVWTRPLDRVLGLVRGASGTEHVEAARAAGHGLILITPHLGCFEIAAHYCATFGPITALYRPPKLAALEPLMLAGRERGPVRLAPTDLSGVRKLLRALKSRESIGLLPDQVPGRGEGEWVDFFGRPAYTMTLATRLAEGSGAPMILVFAERLAWGRGFHMHFVPLGPARAGESGVRRLNRALEDLIRRSPSQYLWGYNRFKVPAGAEPPPERAAAPASGPG